MSADGTLDSIDALLAHLDDHDQCRKCGRWHKLRPHFDVARYTCCNTTFEVNLAPRP